MNTQMISGKKTVILKPRQTIACKYIVEKNANLTLAVFTHGASVDVSVVLAGENACANIIGLVIGKGDDRVRFHTLQHHNAPKTTSDLLVKSVMRESSSFSYTGSIRVDKDAQKTDAYQRNENLLLGTHSQANSSPVLEILANDVRCTHGAVVKTLDDQEIWYLASRGIDSWRARDMIATGFLQSALSLIADSADRQNVKQQLFPS